MKTPRLSVVVATVEPWPEIKGCLESLMGQTRSMKVEVIVTDGSGRGLPPDLGFSDIIWFREKGATVSQLRALGLVQSKGDIVAFTEDHCIVAHDWCEQIIKLHDRYPDAAAIGGVIENGATDSILNWVHFMIANGPFMKPISSGETRSLSGQANVSFKRKFLQDEISDMGIVQMFFNRDFLRRGLKLMMDNRLVVWHIQSLGLSGTCRMHFHTGRTIAGFRIQQLSKLGRMLRLMSCTVLPFFLVMRTLYTAFKKRRNRFILIIGLPMLFLLSICHTTGECLGYISGPGNSPMMVR